MKGLNRSDGFSVLDLMVTCCIMSIVLAIAVPQYATLQRSFAHQTTVKEVEFAIRRARAEGLSHGGRAILSTSNGGTSYTIGIDSAPFSSTNTPDEIVVTSDLAAGTSFVLTDDMLFDSRGFLVDEFGDPTTATLTFYGEDAIYCTGSVFPTAVIDFNCTSGG